MKTYYARCIAIDDTPQYDRDVKTLELLGLDVWKPTTEEKEAGYKREGMEFFLKEVDKCDVLAFRALPSGQIPAGVYKEVQRAIEMHKVIIELPSSITQRELTVQQTREYLREVGKR
jgi:hypothetical protein